MKKSIKKALSLALFGLVMSQASSVSALTNDSDEQNVNKKITIVQQDEKLSGNSNVANADNKDPQIRYTAKRPFFLCHKDSIELPLLSGEKAGDGYIEFKDRKNSRAINIVFKNTSTGKILFDESYARFHDEEGMKKIKFEMKMNPKYDYEIILKNLYELPIEGEIHADCY